MCIRDREYAVGMNRYAVKNYQMTSSLFILLLSENGAAQYITARYVRSLCSTATGAEPSYVARIDVNRDYVGQSVPLFRPYTHYTLLCFYLQHFKFYINYVYL